LLMTGEWLDWEGRRLNLVLMNVSESYVTVGVQSESENLDLGLSLVVATPGGLRRFKLLSERMGRRPQAACGDLAVQVWLPGSVGASQIYPAGRISLPAR
jgi:hypothetical protein